MSEASWGSGNFPYWLWDIVCLFQFMWLRSLVPRLSAIRGMAKCVWKAWIWGWWLRISAGPDQTWSEMGSFLGPLHPSHLVACAMQWDCLDGTVTCTNFLQEHLRRHHCMKGVDTKETINMLYWWTTLKSCIWWDWWEKQDFKTAHQLISKWRKWRKWWKLHFHKVLWNWIKWFVSISTKIKAWPAAADSSASCRTAFLLTASTWCMDLWELVATLPIPATLHSYVRMLWNIMLLLKEVPVSDM